MTTQKTEQQAREEILAMVKEYCNTYHNTKKPFQEGDRIPYASRVYDSAEMCNLVDSALEFWLTSGRYTDQFEKEFAEYLGVKHCSLLLSCEFGLLGQSACVYGAHLPAFGRAENRQGRRGHHGGGGISHDGSADYTIWGGAGVCGRYHTAVQCGCDHVGGSALREDEGGYDSAYAGQSL